MSHSGHDRVIPTPVNAQPKQGGTFNHGEVAAAFERSQEALAAQEAEAAAQPPVVDPNAHFGGHSGRDLSHTPKVDPTVKDHGDLVAAYSRSHREQPRGPVQPTSIKPDDIGGSKGGVVR